MVKPPCYCLSDIVARTDSADKPDFSGHFSGKRRDRLHRHHQQIEVLLKFGLCAVIDARCSWALSSRST